MKRMITLVFITATLAGCSLNEYLQTEDNVDNPLDTENESYEKRQEELSASGDEPETDDEDESIIEEEVEKEDEAEDAFYLEEEFFNETEMVDGQAVIQNPDNVMTFVNREFALPSDYTPDDLVIPDVAFPFDEDVEKKYLREDAANALEELFVAAEEDGYHLFAISGYRSYDRQAVLYENAIVNHGEDQAVSAAPGQSEHQTGLAMDVSSHSNDFGLTEAFGDTEEGQWIAENADSHGFIIRYPKGKEDITGFDYEPWHLRYVGKEVAEVIVENDLTLEEYMELVEKV